MGDIKQEVNDEPIISFSNNAAEPIDLDEYPDEPVRLRRVKEVVEKGKVFETIRTWYSEVFTSLVEEAKPGSPLKLHLKDIATVILSASRAEVIQRHKKEWIKDISKIIKVLKAELDTVETMLEELPRKEYRPSFQKNIVKVAQDKCSRAEQARARAVCLIADLEQHPGEE